MTSDPGEWPASLLPCSRALDLSKGTDFSGSVGVHRGVLLGSRGPWGASKGDCFTDVGGQLLGGRGGGVPWFPAAELAWCGDRLSDKRGPLGDSLAGNVCGLETLGTLGTLDG